MDLVARVVAFVKTAAADFKSLSSAVSSKVDKVEGKGLSTEDYTTTDKGKVASLGDLGGQNLFYNSAMRLSTIPGLADGWKIDVPGSPGASTVTFSLVPSPMNLGENAQRLTVAGLNTSTLYRSLINDPSYQPPRVCEGMNITVSTHVKGTAGLGLRIYVQALSAAGAVLGTVNSALSALDGTVQRFSKSYNNLPVGTTRIQVVYRIYGGTTVTAGVVDFTRPQLQIGLLSSWTEDTLSHMTGWITLPLLSGFSAVASHPPQYRIVNDEVKLRGKVTMGAKVLSGGSYPFATLPAGYRPAGMTTDSEVMMVPVVCSSSVGTACHCSVTRTGTCSIVLGGSLSLASSTYDLSNVSFSTTA
jgi:hypothetical protein